MVVDLLFALQELVKEHSVSPIHVDCHLLELLAELWALFKLLTYRAVFSLHGLDLAHLGPLAGELGDIFQLYDPVV